jgi:DnaJ-class molecular chaperone
MTCPTCNGEGFLLVEEELYKWGEVYEPCPDCHAEGNCPRCGNHIADEAHIMPEKCPFPGCRWKEEPTK